MNCSSVLFLPKIRTSLLSNNFSCVENLHLKNRFAVDKIKKKKEQQQQQRMNNSYNMLTSIWQLCVPININVK